MVVASSRHSNNWSTVQKTARAKIEEKYDKRKGKSFLSLHFSPFFHSLFSYYAPVDWKTGRRYMDIFTEKLSENKHYFLLHLFTRPFRTSCRIGWENSSTNSCNNGPSSPKTIELCMPTGFIEIRGSRELHDNSLFDPELITPQFLLSHIPQFACY